MTYQLVTASTSGALQTSVQEQLNEGWILQGGVMICMVQQGPSQQDPPVPVFAQAMSHMEDKP